MAFMVMASNAHLQFNREPSSQSFRAEMSLLSLNLVQEKQVHCVSLSIFTSSLLVSFPIHHSNHTHS